MRMRMGMGWDGMEMKIWKLCFGFLSCEIDVMGLIEGIQNRDGCNRWFEYIYTCIHIITPIKS